MITRPRTILAALLLAGVALGPRCAGTSYPKAMTESAADSAPHPDPLPAGEREKTAPHPEAMTASAADSAPHPDPLPGGERGKSLVSDPIPGGDSEKSFVSSVRPVLSTRCAPCHEPGGKMYARLPFDDPKTVAANATAMLRRLKGDDRAALERWVAGLAAATPAI